MKDNKDNRRRTRRIHCRKIMCAFIFGNLEKIMIFMESTNNTTLKHYVLRSTYGKLPEKNCLKNLNSQDSNEAERNENCIQIFIDDVMQSQHANKHWNSYIQYMYTHPKVQLQT